MNAVIVNVKKLTVADLKPGDYFSVATPSASHSPDAAKPQYYLKVTAPKDCPDAVCMEKFHLVRHHSQTHVKRYRGDVVITIDEP